MRFFNYSHTVAEAIGNLHKAEIIHLSIKPDNILIRSQTGDEN